jgi:succinate dehydrogenase (ubiquinone) cytochrome b560 subunit
MLHRITGVVLSGPFYIFGAGYLLAPLVGLNFGSASMAAAFGAWPVAAKVATKLVVSLPFTFHAFNGVRHLVWDTGKTFANQTVIKTGFTVFGLSAAASLYLATMV